MIQAQPSGDTLVVRAAQAFAAYQHGDRQAFDVLVEAATPLVWHTVRGQGIDPVAAEDVVQTVWMTLLRSAETVRDPQTVVKWLLTSARRESWRVAKRQRADAERTAAIFGADGEDVLTVPAQREEQPEERVVADSVHRVLWDHFRELPERCRALLRVIAFADRPDYAQIAEALGMPVGSIGPTRGRCLAKLRDQLTRDSRWAETTEGTPT